MKTKILLTVLMILTVSFINQVSGQRLLKSVVNKTQQKTEQKVEDRIMNQVDKGIDKSLDKVEESLESDNKGTDSNSSDTKKNSEQRSQERMTRMMRGMGIAGEPIPIADNYGFDRLIQMHTESFDRSGKKLSSGDFFTYTNKDSKNTAYQSFSDDNSASEKQGIFIVDAENKATIILSDENGEKTGIVYGLSTLGVSEESYQTTTTEEDVSTEFYSTNPNVKKTGKTKKIAGYTCDQFTIDDEDTEGEMWMTRELKLESSDFLGAIFNVGMMSAGMGIGWGYLMESTLIQKETGEKSFMTITKVDPNTNKKFNLSDYNITNMGNISIPTE